ALDAQTVYVLGCDGTLWLEHGPFGTVSPQREQVDARGAVRPGGSCRRVVRLLAASIEGRSGS
ncbi:MAG TPA: hypothetical protein VMU34_17055, partial [Mycobacterium sp.]|nr:hypothetical protein [Mycobacterium sp.]